MLYSIHELATLAGVTSRTLRYYDQIDLLKPCKLSETGYRIYGEEEVDKLQQILFYRSFDLSLYEISEIMKQTEQARLKSLEIHLSALYEKEKQINTIISAMKETIRYLKGEIKMENKQKFEAFKQNAINKNDQRYGKEIREKYGEESIKQANKTFLHMTEEEYQDTILLEKEIKKQLEKAVKENLDAGSEKGKNIAKLHQKWISAMWGSYSVERHLGVAMLYISDERFRMYYDEKQEGCAQFLYEAIKKTFS